MNNTLTIFFADNSVGKMISQLDTPLAVNPAMTLVMDAAKTAVNVKLNIELALESNGAPLVMREQAKKQLFDMVAIEVVGMAVGGVVLKAGSKAFKAIKSFFNKYEFKFKKTNKIDKKLKLNLDAPKSIYGKGHNEVEAELKPLGYKVDPTYKGESKAYMYVKNTPAGKSTIIVNYGGIKMMKKWLNVKLKAWR